LLELPRGFRRNNDDMPSVRPLGGLAGIATITLVGLAVAGCGGSTTTTSRASGPSLRALSSGGLRGQLVFATSDYQTGRIRISFVVLRPDGGLVAQRRARVWVAANVDSPPVAQATAELESITVPGADVNALGSTVL